MPLSLHLPFKRTQAIETAEPTETAVPMETAEPVGTAEPVETAEPVPWDTDDGGVEVEQEQVVELKIQKILGHFVFPGAKVGSLQKVCIRVLYSDGSRSDYIPSEPLHGSAILCKYLKSKNGQKIQKYVPASAGVL